jgi:hypothetical protein
MGDGREGSKNEVRLPVGEDASYEDVVQQPEPLVETRHQRGDFSNCKLCDERLMLALSCLPQSVITLKLGNNFCRSQGAAALANLLMDPTRVLHTIDLSLQHTGESGGSLDLNRLSLALVENISLRHLDLSFNILATDDIQCLVAALSTNNTLLSLNLCKTGLNDAMVQQIGDNLPNMKSLHSLNLLANRFGDSGADALFRGLKSHFVLCKLDIPRGFLASEQMDYLLALNIGGRRLLTTNNNNSSDGKLSPACPIGLWPFIMERVTRRVADGNLQASVLFYLLQEPATCLIHRDLTSV